MKQYVPGWVAHQDSGVFRIGQIHLAEFGRVVAAFGIEFSNQLVVDLHAGCARGKRLRIARPGDDRERILRLVVRRNLHDVPGVVDQPDVRADTDKRHGCALEHRHLKPVRHKPHDGRRFHPWNLLELFAAFIERDEEDVTANVAAENIHHLASGDVLHTGNFNLVAGVDAKPPRALAIAVNEGISYAECYQRADCKAQPLEQVSGFLRKGAAAGGDAPLLSKKRSGILFVEVREACVHFRMKKFLLSGRNFFVRQHCAVCPRHELSLVNRQLLIQYKHFCMNCESESWSSAYKWGTWSPHVYWSRRR